MNTKVMSLKLALLLCLVLQFTAWYNTRNMFPSLGILEEVPSQQYAKVFSLSDDEFYFRIAALELQNSGDSFGRFTALKDYDYKLLSKWMMFLEDFNKNSSFLPALASYYYSNTQTKEDNIYIINYLEHRYDAAPQENWWWLAQAVYVALYKMHNRPIALKLALKLSKSPVKVPVWARQMPAFILEQMGEKEQALAIIQDILKRPEQYSESEINFMDYFVRERLKR